MVEAAGIEPASENHLIRLSPSAAVLFRFPSRAAERQAARYGSHYAVTVGVAPRRSRSPLIDASLPTAVLRGKTGSLIRPPRQQYCCRLFFKIAGFIAGPHRYSLTVPHNPRRNLYAPVSIAVHLIIRSFPMAVNRSLSFFARTHRESASFYPLHLDRTGGL